MHTCIRLMSATNPCALVIIAIVFMVMSGCSKGGPAVVETHGTVTLGGQPVAEADVVFVPKHGPLARAKTQSDGSFVLGTFSKSDGAVVGVHSIAIIARRGGAKAEGDPETKVEWIVPATYASPATSGLTFEVRAGSDNVAAFDLKRP